VVEDNPASRSAYVSMLQRFGADPVGVEGSREAQSAIESQARFDMALLSWHLPGGESPALLEKLRSANGHEAMPCAAIVGIASTAELDRLRELGVSSVLRKPLTGSQLLDAVMDTIGRCALPAPHQEPRKGNERFDGVRVLLVEDNRVNQMVTKEMLKRRGFQISVAENGRHALDQLENEAFDLILMDVQMPVMDGLEATRNIRLIEENARHEGANYKHIPIIAMTANAMQGDERTCLDAGMDAYVAKPLDINLLIERIKLFIRPVNPAEHA
jgi:two-component system sensor histidine kinase/response regulator